MGQTLKHALVYGVKIPSGELASIKDPDFQDLFPRSGLEIEYAGGLQYDPDLYLTIAGAGTRAYDGEPLPLPSSPDWIPTDTKPDWDKRIRDALGRLEWIDCDGNPVPCPEVAPGWLLLCSFG